MSKLITVLLEKENGLFSTALISFILLCLQNKKVTKNHRSFLEETFWLLITKQPLIHPYTHKETKTHTNTHPAHKPKHTSRYTSCTNMHIHTSSLNFFTKNPL